MRWFLLSLFFHIILVAAIVLVSMWPSLFYGPVLVGGFGSGPAPITVEVVGLPNILKKDLAKISEPGLEAEEATSEPEMVLPEKQATTKKKDKKITQTTTTTTKKISQKKSSALEKIKASVKEQESTYLAKTKILKGLQVQEGVSGGTSLGIEISSDAMPSNPYFQTIRDYIRAHWKIPNWIQADNLNTLLVLKLNDDGSIKTLEVHKSSGNNDFDELSINSVKNASPFPSPPLSVKSLIERGVILSFP